MKKRGRKAGSGSFVSVTLEDLNRVLKPNARIIVWGRYAQMLGLDGKQIEAKHETLVAAVSGGTTEVEIKSFGANNNTKSTDVKREDKAEDLIPKPEVSLEVF